LKILLAKGLGRAIYPVSKLFAQVKNRKIVVAPQSKKLETSQEVVWKFLVVRGVVYRDGLNATTPIITATIRAVKNR
jgi:hypothetical protein